MVVWETWKNIISQKNYQESTFRKKQIFKAKMLEVGKMNSVFQNFTLLKISKRYAIINFALRKQ